MATPSQLAVKFDGILKAIRTKISSKLDATAQATDSAKLGGKTLAEVKSAVVQESLGTVNGRRGELPFFKEEGTPMSFVSGEVLLKFRMADNDDAINALKAETVSFADVYNTWQRISHGNNLQFPNNVAEMNSWAYDSATDSASSTVNSGSLIGLIGLDRFEEYTFETIMKSTGGDDDTIGMCAAFKRANGREYTLTVLVSGGGMLPAGNYDETKTPVIWCGVNYNQGAANGAVPLWSQELGIPRQTWAAAGPLQAGIKVKVVRKKTNQLEITATQADGTPWPNPIFATVDIPVMFQSPCQIGYIAVSQPAATWKNLQVPVAKRDIIDSRDKTVWRWNATTSSWVNAGKFTNPDVMTPGRLYKNTVAPYWSYYLDFEGSLLVLGGPGVL